MLKGKIVWWVFLFSILVFLLYFKSHQDAESKAKAFGIAIEKAKALGYETGKMTVTQENLDRNMSVVAFQSNKQSKIHDLEIYLRHENIYEIEVLGTYNNVDPEKDREKIAVELLNNSIKSLKSIMPKDKNIK